MTSNNTSEPERLDPSELGTKEYWDNIYTLELQNNAEDGEDEGHVWFSESNAEDVVSRELDKLVEQGFLRRGVDDDDGAGEASRFLDLGTGNGHMLFSLRQDEGWQGEMVGIDYSAGSIELARRIERQSREAASPDVSPAIRFEQWDLLSSSSSDPTWLGDGFDVVLDKGTFDAISLMPQGEGEAGGHACEQYRRNVTPLVKAGGFLLVTSCNWTRDEVVRWLASEGELEFYAEAKYPTFTFGGKKGQSVVTVIFRKQGLRRIDLCSVAG